MSHRRESTPPEPARTPSAPLARGARRVTAKASSGAELTAGDCLMRALQATDSASRLAWASRGLALDVQAREGGAEELDPELQVLLLRQLYLAHVAEDRLAEALAVAEQMVAVGPMLDIAEHDRARVLQALDRLPEAILAQRRSSRAAPPDRRSFQTTALGTLLFFAGEHGAALEVLDRAERWSHRDRPLIRALAAYVELVSGRVPESLEAVRRALTASPLREGYGQFVLGMIALELGDRRRAAVHLRAFLWRNASADRAKAITLREELVRARRALASIESD